MVVEIWSDIACPWCYVGKRRFEAALAGFDHEVEVVWRSFELDPGAPASREESAAEHLSAKYGMPVEEARARQAQLAAMAAADGLEFNFDRVRSANTFDAHRLTHLAKAHGLQDAMVERLQRAHFTDGELLSDHATLARLAERGRRAGRGGDARERPLHRRGARRRAARAGHRHHRGADVRGRPPRRGRRRAAARGAARAAPARRAGQLISISPPSANGGTRSMRSPLQKRPGSYQLAGRPLGQQAHVLVGRGDELGAVDGLQRGLAAAEAAGQPLAREARRRGERAAVEALDRLHQPVLVLALELALELAHPGALAVALVPRADGVARAGAAGRRAGARRSTRRAASGRARRATAAAGGRRARRPCRRG